MAAAKGFTSVCAEKSIKKDIFYIEVSTILCTFATDFWKFHS